MSSDAKPGKDEMIQALGGEVPEVIRKTGIRSSHSERQKLRSCGVGVGVMFLNLGSSNVAEIDFYLDEHGLMRFLSNDKPILFQFENDNFKIMG